MRGLNPEHLPGEARLCGTPARRQCVVHLARVGRHQLVQRACACRQRVVHLPGPLRKLGVAPRKLRGACREGRECEVAFVRHPAGCLRLAVGAPGEKVATPHGLVAGDVGVGECAACQAELQGLAAQEAVGFHQARPHAGQFLVECRGITALPRHSFDLPIAADQRVLGLPAFAGKREPVPQPRRGTGGGEAAEGRDRFRRLGAHRQHTEPVGMQELERRIQRPLRVPEPPDTEVALTHVGVMQQHDATRRKLGQPAVEILGDVGQAVASVDMQQVDAGVGEGVERAVEPATEQAREAAVALVVEAREILEYVLAIEAGMLVTLPGIDGKAAGRQTARQHGVAEAGIGDPGMGAELDEQRRAGGAHDPVGERQMPIPRTVRTQPAGPVEQRLQSRVDQGIDQGIKVGAWRLRCLVGHAWSCRHSVSRNLRLRQGFAACKGDGGLWDGAGSQHSASNKIFILEI